MKYILAIELVDPEPETAPLPPEKEAPVKHVEFGHHTPVYIAHPLLGSTPDAKRLGFGDPERNMDRYYRFCALAASRGLVPVTWSWSYHAHTRGFTAGEADFYLSMDRKLVQMVHDHHGEFWQCGPLDASSGLVRECAWWGGELGHGTEGITCEDGWLDANFMPPVWGVGA